MGILSPDLKWGPTNLMAAEASLSSRHSSLVLQHIGWELATERCDFEAAPRLSSPRASSRRFTIQAPDEDYKKTLVESPSSDRKHWMRGRSLTLPNNFDFVPTVATTVVESTTTTVVHHPFLHNKAGTASDTPRSPDSHRSKGPPLGDVLEIGNHSNAAISPPVERRRSLIGSSATPPYCEGEGGRLTTTAVSLIRPLDVTAAAEDPDSVLPNPTASSMNVAWRLPPRRRSSLSRASSTSDEGDREYYNLPGYSGAAPFTKCLENAPTTPCYCDSGPSSLSRRRRSWCSVKGRSESLWSSPLFEEDESPPISAPPRSPSSKVKHPTVVLRRLRSTNITDAKMFDNTYETMPAVVTPTTRQASFGRHEDFMMALGHVALLC
jgi:hypothetical protein